MRAVYQVVTGTPGHPDRFPYIDTRLQVATVVPPGVQFCANRQGERKVLVAQLARKKNKEEPANVTHRGDPKGEPVFPPPCIPAAQPAAAQAPRHPRLRRPDSPRDHRARVHGASARPHSQSSNLRPFRCPSKRREVPSRLEKMAHASQAALASATSHSAPPTAAAGSGAPRPVRRNLGRRLSCSDRLANSSACPG